MRKKNRNKRGQAVVEYVLVLAVMVMIILWGLGTIKCSLHTIWIKMACDVIQPYPQGKIPNKLEYCTPEKKCFDL